MGNGIAHVFAQHEYNVNLIDISDVALSRGLSNIEKNLDRMVAREKIDLDMKNATLSRISAFSSMEKGVANSELIV
mgnify:FL=1